MFYSTEVYGKLRNPSQFNLGLRAIPPCLMQAESLYESKISFQYKNLCSTCKTTQKNCFNSS